MQCSQGYKQTEVADLAVHTVCHASMARYAVPKVLDFEATLEAACKEAAKGSNDGCKGCQHNSMKLRQVDKKSMANLATQLLQKKGVKTWAEHMSSWQHFMQEELSTRQV